MVRLVPLLLCAGILCACGSASDSTSPTTTSDRTTTTLSARMALTVYRVVDGRLRPETAQVPRSPAVAQAALDALGVPATVTIDNGRARVALDQADDERVASIVYTLTQFPSVQRVDVAGQAGLTRDDVAQYVPPIMVESPVTGASVSATFTVSGTASVFEATLFVELRRGNKVLEKKTVTASEGAPGRGTFSVDLHAPSAGAATVAVYSPSAADGSAQHEQDLRIVVTP
jgi:immunoglobulin-like protein involved in spore germination/sporulation and spore germination protein